MSLLDYPDWHVHSTCANDDAADPEWFTPGPGYRPDLALPFCAGCPTKQLCLQQAIDENLDGVWGGTERPERLHLAARRTLRPI